MTAKVKQWGNSQGIRLSKDILKIIGLQVGDEIDLDVTKNEIIISKKFKHKTLEERYEEFNGPILHLEEYNWGEPVGRERW
ncbi:MAG: AbrB/MazE/SpoVT family DNA-binding domain-containing protein [Lachnospiraceae bacterium]|jgi:antitoxin MazE|nr:AbrB/MazE/SpoVT family DNA-binding domain-containing protein [Lachnospiraceae bacterium]